MKREERKEIDRLLKNAEYVVLATSNGVGALGIKPRILTGFSKLTGALTEAFGEEEMREIFELAFKSNEELQ